MKIYVTHAKNSDYINDLYIPIRRSDLNSMHEITLPHENNTKPFQSKPFIKTCDLVLAEVSYPATGQGIELGWADIYNIPIVCFYKKGIKPSGSLRVVSNTFIEYENKKNMIQKLSDVVSTFLK